jgi:hypothetical protein
MTHDELVEAAEEAINKVFGDTSVSRSETKESLNSIIGHINTMLDTLSD